MAPLLASRQACGTQPRPVRLVAGGWPLPRGRSVTTRAAQSARQEQPPGDDVAPPDAPPDVLPHVLLALDPLWEPHGGPAGDGGAGDGAALLSPATAARLHSTRAPGFFLPRRVRDPALAAWQAQALEAWQAAAAWAAEVQRGGEGLQEQHAPPLPLPAQQPPHWGQLAAVLAAAGPQLRTQHLAALAAAAAGLAGAGGAAASRALRPPMLAITPPDGGSGGAQLVLKCAQLLPQLSGAVAQELQRGGQLAPPDAVALLQQLAALHATGRVGAADAEAAGALLAALDLSACSLQQHAAVIASCAALGQPLRSSWLAGFVASACQRLPPAGGGGEGGDGDVGAAIARLLDGLSLYPGPHIVAQQLQPLLAAAQPHLGALSAREQHQLLTAAAALQLAPDAELLDAAAAAALSRITWARRQPSPAAALPLGEAALLLQGLAAAGHAPGAAWWEAWTEHCLGVAAATSLAHPAAAAAPQRLLARADEAGVFGGEVLRAAELEQQEAAWAAAAAAQAGHAQPPHAPPLRAEVVSELCLLLQQLGRPLPPIQLCALLEAYVRSGYEPAATPQLLLVAAQGLPSAPGFAADNRLLLQRLLSPLQERFSELSAEQLAQAAEACVAYDCRPGVEWFRWHGAAVLRLGRVCPLEALARVRQAYAQLGVAAEERLRVLLDTVPWRLQRQAERARGAERLAAQGAALAAKNEQRRRQNAADAAARGARGRGQRPAGAPGPEGRQAWRARKLKPPGTLDRKF
ncbi:hypothetical protein HT031_000997 [Scenedesmus sp. PABB004]|nr:hypothetical protein HT031_000997 [Scenedesmus sp. PABB004]